jgi:hypothetical protein
MRPWNLSPVHLKRFRRIRHGYRSLPAPKVAAHSALSPAHERFEGCVHDLSLVLSPVSSRAFFRERHQLPLWSWSLKH